jgi:hypothetical protein
MNLFVSYSHKDSRWLERLLVHLRPLERDGHIDIWSDKRIDPGVNWSAEIQTAIADSETAVLLVSADFLASEFIVSNELPPLLLAAKMRDCIIIPVIVGPCLFSSIKGLREFQAVNSPREPLTGMSKSQAEDVLCKVARTILGRISPEQDEHAMDLQRDKDTNSSPSARRKLVGSPVIDALIADVKLAAWDEAQRVALRVLSMTDSAGRNEVFESLLDYQDCSDEEDRFWGATQTIECCLRLAPWLINHIQLSRLAAHKNFSVRSVAASICMDMAHAAPDRVPIDILQKLSVYDEDWYVETPANSAIKAMAHSFPAVLNVFYERLKSNVAEERSHAAIALHDVALKEPWLLDSKLLKRELVNLRRLGDDQTSNYLKRVLLKLEGVKPKDPYIYGL